MTVKELHNLCFHAKVKLKVDGTLYPLTAISILSLTFSGLREAGKRGGINSRWNWERRCKYGLY